MSQLINQKFLQGIDSSKFKIAANGALMAVDSQGNLVEILKLNAQDQALVLGIRPANKSDLDQAIADLTAEIAAREVADQALSGRIGSLESAMPTKASITYVNTQDGLTLDAAKLYADQKVSELVNGAPGVLDTLKEIADALGNDANLAGTLSGQIGSVQSGLASEISRATAAEAQVLSDSKDYTDNKVQNEASARIVGDAAALSDAKAYADAKDDARKNYVDAQDNLKLAEAKAYADQKVSDEASARAAADTAKLAEAKAYADSKFSEEQLARQAADSAMQSDIDDLDVYAQDIRADLDQEILDRQSAVSAEAAARASAISAEESARVSAINSEESARISADNALSARITTLETQPSGPSFKYKTMTIGDKPNDLEYIELDFQARENGVMAVSLDRLMLVPGVDFSVSSVGGKTRLTWIGDLVSPGGDQAVELGDFVFISYAV